MHVDCALYRSEPSACNVTQGASMVNIFYAPRYTPDTLPLRLHLLLTVGVVVVATLLGILCENVSVVLAYKGSIFGSNMVYIFPPLMCVRVGVAPRGCGNAWAWAWQCYCAVPVQAFWAYSVPFFAPLHTQRCPLCVCFWWLDSPWFGMCTVCTLHLCVCVCCLCACLSV